MAEGGADGRLRKPNPEGHTQTTPVGVRLGFKVEGLGLGFRV